jgi:TonB family protein
MKISRIFLLVLALSVRAPATDLPAPSSPVRGDVLYLPDTPSSRENAEHIRKLYHFQQEIIFRNLDRAHLTNPKRGKMVPPQYPASFSERRIGGSVKVIFIVDEHGRVAEAAVVSSTDPLLEASALGAVRKWQFRPATYDGIPIRTLMDQVISFALD